MCGISGTVGFTQEESLQVLNHQHHRGPDNMDYKLIHGVFLGHNRLSIIDLSEKGNQPMCNYRYSLVYNGEIYNYKDLKNRLITHDVADDDMGDFQSHYIDGNDARTLLNYIEVFGLDQALKDINGMYAFALYDKIENKIYLVVDRFGQKPLYYYQSGEKFAFASSVGALMSLKDKWSIDEEGLKSYWLLGSTMGETSMISGIKRVTGSHILSYDVQKHVISQSRYWTPQYQTNTDCIEELIIDSINKVKVSDMPVYTFLSGGIDSTLVASQFEGGNAVHLGEKEFDYAKLAADKFNINLLQVNPKEWRIEESLKDYAFKTGEPSMASIIPYITAKEVSKFAKVAISANGADELFFGYDRTKQDFCIPQRQHILRSIIPDHEMHDFLYPKFADPYDYEDERLSSGRWMELISYVQFDLNKTLDGAAMCHGLEVRSPFLDHRLVEMALSIPEGKHYTPSLGRKSILKLMLQKVGFSREFLTRPKLGFSLHTEPDEMQNMKIQAVKWCRENNFLKVNDWNALSERDQRYLEMSCLSFYYWYKTWEHKL
jgi:asparagine synthase (glutamine-hydrolysing)